MSDRDDPLESFPPWFHLLDDVNKAWREDQIVRGKNPDPYIEAQLKAAGVWPPSKKARHA